MYEGEIDYLVSHCTAMRNLIDKAKSGNKFSHSEAFHFADVMLSVISGAEFIHNTMRVSLKDDYNSTITNEEIEKISPLHPPNCITLVRKKICPDYCKKSVQKRSEDPLVPGISPCGVWLKRIPTKLGSDKKSFLDRVGKAENVKRAFYQLKQYQKYEDSLFFDQFDFEHFENQLDANIQVLVNSLIEEINIPFDGYIPVSIPKKLNDEQEMEYRQMSYSTIYDQAPIQAIFNIIGPIIDGDFQTSSYGYRWNDNTSTPLRIFKDWRESYPRFRNNMLAGIKRHPKGFHFCCDIKGFYDNIGHSILLEQIKPYVSDKYLYQKIKSIIQAYEFPGHDGNGLPQGPAYARLLANLYLNDFDIFAGELSIAYFRYVDDFVLVFENERDAEQGLESVIRRLQLQGLELSQDEEKKAIIKPNIDISRVRKTLERVHYGILEGTRHLEYFSPQALKDFWDAVERHSISDITPEKLININEVLPTLLYVVTRESLFQHPLKLKIFSLVEFLIKQSLFYPKKLKIIFYRLIDLNPDTDSLIKLFQSMEPIHKVYFLLNVYDYWKVDGQHQQLLRKLVKTALMAKNEFILGFAMVIFSKHKEIFDSTVNGLKLIQGVSKAENNFILLKWLSTINYLDQSLEERDGIREIVDPRSSDLIKLYVLTNISNLPTVYVDSLYLEGLLPKSGVLLLPAVCDLLILATDRSSLFDSLLDFALARLEFKPLVLSLIKSGIFKLRTGSGLAEIENLKSLYDHVSDAEVKKTMQDTLSRIMQYDLKSDEIFAKRHSLISRYNECFLFESIEEGTGYNYLELIPVDRLRGYLNCGLTTFKIIIDDFVLKNILPPSKIVYNSGSNEIRLEFNGKNHYCLLDPQEFSLTPKSIQRSLNLAVEVYRKANYFRRLTGKSPRISPDNLLVNTSTGEIVFRSIGQSLCATHIFGNTTVGDEESDIAKMISMLLESLLFTTEAKATEFKDENKVHSGINAFLAFILKRMGSKEPGYRYSCSRLEYLVNQITTAPEQGLTKNWKALIYLRERLKDTLYRYNSEIITWNGICRALDLHLSKHIRVICTREDLRAFPFRSRVFFMNQGKRQLHTLSQHLLDLALSREDFPGLEKVDATYFDLVEFLLLYASVCVEIAALGKTLRITKVLERLMSSNLLKEDRVKVIAGDKELYFSTADISALLIQDSNETIEATITGLSLYQLSLKSLFACKVDISNDSIKVMKLDNMSDEVFHSFVHACLFRIPNIETIVEKRLREVNMALESNDSFTKINELEQIRNDVKILAKDFRQIRKIMGLSRVYGRASGEYFPPDVHCRSIFHRKRIVTDKVLTGCGLTHSFPSSKVGYKSSWDLIGTSVNNLMIPSEGVNLLMEDLQNGNFFGFKLSDIYSGKLMIFIDIFAFLINGFLLLASNALMESADTLSLIEQIASFFNPIFNTLTWILFLKINYDLIYWSSKYHKFFMYIKKRFSRVKEL